MIKTVYNRLFDGLEKKLVVYNRHAVLDWPFYFTVQEGCEDEADGFDFPGYVSSYLRVYNERSGALLKDLAMSHNGPYLVLNGSVADMTFEDEGVYYYEIGYNRAGYDIALGYGPLHVI